MIRTFFRPIRKSGCYNNKRESYADATITPKFRLVKLVLLIKGNEVIIPVECISDTVIIPCRALEVRHCFPNVSIRLSVRPSAGHDSNLRDANAIQYVGSTESLLSQ